MNTDILIKRYEYGIDNEMNFYEILKSYNNNIIKSTDKYNWTDFQLSNDYVNIYFELKTRNVCKNRYKTTILALNKVQNYLVNKVGNKKNRYYIIFGFIGDDNKLDYWYIRYNKELFNTFSVYDVFDQYQNETKRHYLIDVNLLKPLNGLLEIIKNISS